MTLTFDPLTSKSIGIIHWSSVMHQRSLRTNMRWVVKLLIGNRSYVEGNCDSLTFDPLTPNQRTFLVMNNYNTTFEVPRPKCFLVIYLQGQCYLDLLPLDPKISSHLLVMSNHHTKFEVPRLKRSLVIDWTLTFDP
jgi:hypothetical protein